VVDTSGALHKVTRGLRKLGKALCAHWVQWIAAVALLGTLAAGAALYYATRVCEEHVTQAGNVIPVCRKLGTTDPPMVGLELLALLALTRFFSEISGFGISLKRKLEQASKDASAARTLATDAKSAAIGAVCTTRVTEEVTVGALRSQSGTRAADPQDTAREIDDLAHRYDTIRATQPPGILRTSQMTGVAAELVRALIGADRTSIDVPGLVSDPTSSGRRLAGYAHGYAHPAPENTRALVSALLSEPEGFGQYWAIRALAKTAATAPTALDFTTRRNLAAFLDELDPHTDRAYELRQLLSASTP
jgi:hypothetical protein